MLRRRTGHARTRQAMAEIEANIATNNQIKIETKIEQGY
jgi:hypothetical protein